MCEVDAEMFAVAAELSANLKEKRLALVDYTRQLNTVDALRGRVDILTKENELLNATMLLLNKSVDAYEAEAESYRLKLAVFTMNAEEKTP